MRELLRDAGCELIYRERFRNQVEAGMAISDYVESRYDPHPRHSALDYDSPVEFEKRHATAS